MNPKKAIVGTHVRIANDISKTNRRFSSNESMRDMRGKVYRITKVLDDRIKVGNWVWHPDDIIEIEEPEEIKEKIFHFDPSVM